MLLYVFFTCSCPHGQSDIHVRNNHSDYIYFMCIGCRITVNALKQKYETSLCEGISITNYKNVGYLLVVCDPKIGPDSQSLGITCGVCSKYLCITWLSVVEGGFCILLHGEHKLCVALGEGYSLVIPR